MILPKYLIDNGLFCCWKFEKRDGRQTKVPYDPRTGQRARSNDPSSFVDYNTAVHASGYDGIGVGIFGTICCIDLDECINEDGQISPVAVEIVSLMHSYTEVSPSGKGLHIWFTANGFVFNKEKFYVINHNVGIEVYIAGATNKYVTVTGKTVPGYDYRFGERTVELKELLDRFMRRPEVPFVREEKSSANLEWSEESALAAAKKDTSFCKLWNGSTEDFSSQSEADYALCARLAFYTRKDPSMMDSLFRKSALMRPKWDEKRGSDTYGILTINKATSRCPRVYVPPIVKENSLKAVSLEELFCEQFSDFPPIVEEFIYPGITVLFGDSKIGKSFLSLQLGYCVSTGQDFLNMPVQQGVVLYLALEDTPKRVAKRLLDMFGGESGPDLFIATASSRLGEGLETEIAQFCDEHPRLKMIIIDTFQLIRAQLGSNVYAEDYSVIQTLKQIADTRAISIVLIHHTRKQKSKDLFQNINGTTAIMGAADAAICMSKDNRQSDEARLDITGRDVETRTVFIVRNPSSPVWEYAGASNAENFVPPDPILESVSMMVDEFNPIWTGTATQLCEKAGINVQPNVLAANLNVKGDELLRLYGIKYTSFRNHEGRGVILEYKGR